MASIGSSAPKDVTGTIPNDTETTETKTVPNELIGSKTTSPPQDTGKTVPQDPKSPKPDTGQKLDGSKPVKSDEGQDVTETKTVVNNELDNGNETISTSRSETATRTNVTGGEQNTAGKGQTTTDEMIVDPEITQQTHENVRERLGQGGQGSVDRLISTEPTEDAKLAVESGEREYSGKDFPTYIVKSSLSGSSGTQQLLDEGKTQKLDLGDHPRLAKGLGVTGNNEIVMEELRGGSGKDILKQLVTTYKEAPTEDRETALKEFIDIQKAIAHMTLEGLSHMHEKGFVHNDIKPGNVAFDEDMSLKLIDFGATKPEDQTTEQSTPKYHPRYTPDHKDTVMGFGSKPWHDVFSVGRMVEDSVRQISDVPGATDVSVEDGVFSYDVPFEEIVNRLPTTEDTVKKQLLEFVELAKTGSSEWPFNGTTAQEALDHPFLTSLEGEDNEGVWMPPEGVTTSLTQARLQWYQQTWQDRAGVDTPNETVSSETETSDETPVLGEDDDGNEGTGDFTETTVQFSGDETVQTGVDPGEDDDDEDDTVRLNQE